MLLSMLQKIMIFVLIVFDELLISVTQVALSMLVGSAVSRLCSGDSVNNRLSSILHSYACVLKAPLILRSVSRREERFPCNGRVRLRYLQNKRTQIQFFRVA